MSQFPISSASTPLHSTFCIQHPQPQRALVHTQQVTAHAAQVRSSRAPLLEEWVYAFAAPASSSASAHSAARPSTSTSRSNSTDDGGRRPSTIYKSAIPLFRALFALLHVLPAWNHARQTVGAQGWCCVLRTRTGGRGGVWTRPYIVLPRWRLVPSTRLLRCSCHLLATQLHRLRPNDRAVNRDRRQR
ncbi:hypothetical protein B0H15DRAFT_1027288 [Mycena belliarum]|uniref:Autophagy-related protein 13 n=1 Tax=Mycena belliarum TaxID=1033014 RepID=A0AAD6TNZ9_9AGAR|nr:hypothetical protein B0H15DRAFT_1027288 [Mycena belliae]